MADSFTPNKSLDKPPNGADPGTWDQPVNANADAVDSALGDVVTLNAGGASGFVTLTLAQYRPANIVITGAPSAQLTYLLPTGVGAFFFVRNLCTGASNTVNFGAAGIATAVAVPGGVSAVIVIDPVYGGRLADSIAQEAVGPTGAVQYAAAGGLVAGDAGLSYTPGSQALAVLGGLSVGGALAVTGFVTKRLILNQGGANTRSVAIPYSAASMAMNCALSNVFTSTLAGNVTGAVAISGQDDGQTINWRIQQDATGNRTMVWPANFRWPGGVDGVLSTVPSAVDLLVATFFSATGTWLAGLLKGFA